MKSVLNLIALSVCASKNGSQKRKNKMIELQISGLPKTPNELKKMHWGQRAKEAKRWRQATAWMALKHKPKRPYQCFELTFIRCSSKECDYDNGVASIKSLLDGLRDSGIIPDDTREFITGKNLYFGWEKAAPGAGSIKIIIVPL